jgi:hypothetical protein
MNDTISISQKIYLLGIHPKKGGIIVSAQSAMNYVLIGTLLLELYLNKNVDFEKNRVIVRNQKSSNTLHQFLLDKISRSSRNLKTATWINKFTFSMKFIRKEVQKELMQKRIIRMKQKRFLIFRWESPVIVNFQLLYRLLSETENMVFKGTTENEDLFLLSFLKPAGLISRIFPEREKRKFAREKLNKIMAENQVSVATANAIAAANAVAASVAVLAAVSSATHSS